MSNDLIDPRDFEAADEIVDVEMADVDCADEGSVKDVVMIDIDDLVQNPGQTGRQPSINPTSQPAAQPTAEPIPGNTYMMTNALANVSSVPVLPTQETINEANGMGAKADVANDRDTSVVEASPSPSSSSKLENEVLDLIKKGKIQSISLEGGRIELRF